MPSSFTFRAPSPLASFHSFPRPDACSSSALGGREPDTLKTTSYPTQPNPRVPSKAAIQATTNRGRCNAATCCSFAQTAPPPSISRLTAVAPALTHHLFQVYSTEEEKSTWQLCTVRLVQSPEHYVNGNRMDMQDAEKIPALGIVCTACGDPASPASCGRWTGTNSTGPW
ncbi:hypothetical protein SEVIR_4G010801v4 [Setaria viridis]|uniref:Uncharacterized protein n=1 Tax=Setaria viridis TaxID=4556 RepID=A0A4U6USC0_SETVI|nr:hypothetical protein SEVIR_4G010801v2 [Setaria viridis]